MEIFFELIIKILPLYLIVVLGFIAGKYLDINSKGLGKLIIYIVAPFVIFEGTTHAELSYSYLLIPFLAFFISFFIATVFFYYGRYKWNDTRANVLAIVASEGNTGYFGIPVALLLFDQKVFGFYIMGTVGITIFENTVVFYLAARGKYSVKDSFIRLARLPAIYAFILAIFFLYFNISLPKIMDNFVINMRGTYVVLGMMLIGFGISAARKTTLDYQFIFLSFLGKFVIWPLVIFFLITIDIYIFNIFTIDVYRAFLLLAIVPIAANTVVFATVLNIYPEKVSSAVILSTLFGLFYVPLFIVFFINKFI